ncbi:hypothetical protein KJ562_00140 [Patescibacteria group bacterium]|nr:hypothetical protein [Patescibacteria group bacterium]
MLNLAALIILVISFGGMFFIIIRKWPKLRTAEIMVSGAATHEPLRERFRKKMAGLGSTNGFSTEKLMKKALIKTKILFLKGERRADHYLRKVSHSQKFKEDYWGEMDKK